MHLDTLTDKKRRQNSVSRLNYYLSMTSYGSLANGGSGHNSLLSSHVKEGEAALR